MNEPKPICEFCGHLEKDHCAGNVSHSNYKDAMRQVRQPRTSKCVSRHCTQPLCCCVYYKPNNQPYKTDSATD